ncbi:uncharacterized protein LOC130623710 isoform X2 [Hydractinia symbiolongicarpus]|uniref:uncharacterized protein LOC130623710 isoform X2 n=1 Tax=Hydractinia symbiolongicarpus TaxID=13093 RepID=UPI00254ABE02|nr:uncharacterized protein LOC130623710 isoform X2 [Hydractinia symbiolongicarpus]
MARDETEIFDTWTCEAYAYEICNLFLKKPCRSCLITKISIWSLLRFEEKDDRMRCWATLCSLVIFSFDKKDVNRHLQLLDQIPLMANTLNLENDDLQTVIKFLNTMITLIHYENQNIRKARQFMQRNKVLYEDKIDYLLNIKTNATYPEELQLENIQSKMFPFIHSALKKLGKPRAYEIISKLMDPAKIRYEKTNKVGGKSQNDQSQLQDDQSQSQDDHSHSQGDQSQTQDDQSQSQDDQSQTQDDQNQSQSISTSQGDGRSQDSQGEEQSQSILPDKRCNNANVEHDPMEQVYPCKVVLKRTNPGLVNKRSSGVIKDINDGMLKITPTRMETRGGKHSITYPVKRKSFSKSKRAKSASILELTADDGSPEDLNARKCVPEKSVVEEEKTQSNDVLNSPAGKRKKVVDKDNTKNGNIHVGEREEREETNVRGGERKEQPQKLVRVGSDGSKDDDLTISWNSDNEDEPQYRRKRVAFTDEEERFLIEGISHIGVGKWAAILRRYKFHQCRTSVSLKDKYRTMKKQGYF